MQLIETSVLLKEKQKFCVCLPKIYSVKNLQTATLEILSEIFCKTAVQPMSNFHNIAILLQKYGFGFMDGCLLQKKTVVTSFRKLTRIRFYQN